MKNIGLKINIKTDKDFKISNKVINLLLNNNFNVILNDYLKTNFASENVVIVDDDEFYKKSDVIVTLGGDGTLLRAAYKSALNDKLMIGINLGNLGYLAHLTIDDIDKIVDILNSKLSYQKRMMLSCKILSSDGKVKEEYHALNDVVINKGKTFNSVSIDLADQNSFISSYYCDGMIFSTPTGSTAYSLSAGGPIMDPEINAIILTPICCHSIYAKPLVFSDNTTLYCCKTNVDNEYLTVCIDGKIQYDLEYGDKVVITKSPYVVKLISTENSDFYGVLNKKLINRR